MVYALVEIVREDCHDGLFGVDKGIVFRLPIGQFVCRPSLAVRRKSDCTAGAVNYVTPPNSVCSYGVLNVTQRSIR